MIIRLKAVTPQGVQALAQLSQEKENGYATKKVISEDPYTVDIIMRKNRIQRALFKTQRQALLNVAHSAMSDAMSYYGATTEDYHTELVNNE